MQNTTNPFVAGMVALALFAAIGCNSNQGTKSPDSSGAGQPPVQQARPAPPPSPKILTKDAEYTRLLNPPGGEALLGYSGAYKQKKQEIEAKLLTISDADLRSRVASEEWSTVDTANFEKDADAQLRAAFPAAMQACLLKHRGDWFEVGHVEYPGTDLLTVTSVAASPVEFPDGLSIAMNVSAMDGVYSRFHQLVGQQLEQQTNAWMNSENMEICRQLPGACTPPTYQEALKKVEQEMRSQRIVLVGQGDLVEYRIDKLMLVDYDTETILLNLDPALLTNKEMHWKYSGGDKQAREKPAHAQQAEAEPQSDDESQ